MLRRLGNLSFFGLNVVAEDNLNNNNVVKADEEHPVTSKSRLSLNDFSNLEKKIICSYTEL